MVKFLLELGIDPSKMNALEVEDKLQEVKRIQKKIDELEEKLEPVKDLIRDLEYKQRVLRISEIIILGEVFMSMMKTR
jgi:hypothetical protein